MRNRIEGREERSVQPAVKPVEVGPAREVVVYYRRRWLMNSGSALGTSVSPIAPLTYRKT